MDLAFNAKALFTRWVVASGLLREPFVVVDIGVQGGENPRWHLLGDRLVVHGFDAIKEVIDELTAKNSGRANRHYHWIGAGNEDGERDFFQRLDDPCSSSFWQPGDDRSRAGPPLWEARRVRIRKLDSLLAEQAIPPADFLKVDVEGFEKQVFLGAGRLLASGVLGIETETNFGISPEYQVSHFSTLQGLLIEHGLLVFDLNFNRIPSATFQQALRRAGQRMVTDQASVGKPSTVVVLFCRDLIQEKDHPEHYAAPLPTSPTIDQVIKTMIIYELHGLNDVAVDTAERFREQLTGRLEVDKALTLLADPNCRHGSEEREAARGLPVSLPPQGSLTRSRWRIVRALRFLRRWRRWRIVAPLRTLRRWRSRRIVVFLLAVKRALHSMNNRAAGMTDRDAGRRR
jgi:FkbM family methyltransferase